MAYPALCSSSQYMDFSFQLENVENLDGTMMDGKSIQAGKLPLAYFYQVIKLFARGTCYYGYSSLQIRLKHFPISSDET
jgi:hypothetical protein